MTAANDLYARPMSASPQRLAERLQRLRLRDVLLRPRRTLTEVRELAAFAERAHHRSLEAAFFSNDSQRNRLGRDGFFDVAAWVGVRRYRARGQVPGRVGVGVADALSLEFGVLPGADVAKYEARLREVAASFAREMVEVDE